MKISGRMIGLMMVVGVVLLGKSYVDRGTRSQQAQLPVQPQASSSADDSTVSAWAEVLEQRPDPKVVTDADLLKRITETKLPWRVRHNGSGIEMLLVPPGTFMMGASHGDTLAQASESPAHQVTISSAFYIGRYEVTQAQWHALMDSSPSHFTGDLFPVERVSFKDVALFLKKAGGGLTLPTEAQWEYACRAGSTGPTYGDLDLIAWSKDTAGGTTNPVGKTRPNALGLYDTLGNVWEWCSDWYSADYYSSSPSSDPTGLPSGPYRVLRGGSWEDHASYCRGSQRCYTPVYSYYSFGFRSARNP